MATKMENIQIELLDKFEEVSSKFMKFTNINFKWFHVTTHEKPITFCISSIGQLIIYDSKKSVNLINKALNSSTIDYSMIPDYIAVGYGTIYMYPDDFNASRKKPGKCHKNLTYNEYLLVIDILEILERTLKNNFDDLENEKADYIHYIRLSRFAKNGNIRRADYGKRLLKRKMFTPTAFKKSNKPLDIQPKTSKYTLSLDVFEINIPVLFRDKDEVLNPFLILYSNSKTNCNSHFIVNCKYEEIPDKLVEIVMKETKLPDKVQVCDYFGSKVASRLKKLGITVFTLIPEQVTFEMENNFQAVILEDNYEFLLEHGYLEYDDVKDAYENIDKMYAQFTKMTKNGHLDPMLFQFSNQEFNDLMTHYNKETPEHIDEFLTSNVFFALRNVFFFTVNPNLISPTFEGFTEYLDGIQDYVEDVNPEMLEKIKNIAKNILENPSALKDPMFGFEEVFGSNSEFDEYDEYEEYDDDDEDEDDLEDELNEYDDFNTTLVS